MAGSTLTYKIQDTHKVAKQTSYSNSGVVIGVVNEFLQVSGMRTVDKR